MTSAQFTTVALADIAVVTAAAAVCAGICRRIGQPGVVGQILAGVLLGPTALGRLWPAAGHWLFRAEVLPLLQGLGQLAVVLFMFSVGYEMRIPRRLGRAVPVVSFAALALPLALGVGVGLTGAGGLRRIGETDVSSPSFLIYLGVATGISALPVMGAIVRERGLAGTPVATLALASAGLMDVVAWLVLATVLVAVGAGHQRPPAATAGLLGALVLVLFAVIRPALGWYLRHSGPSGDPTSHVQVPMALVLALGTAAVTSALGLDAVLGGLLAGLAMPSVNGVPDVEVVREMERTGNLLLPLFFTVTGLSLSLGALHGPDLLMLILVCAAAFAGKLAGGYGAGRLVGCSRPDSAILAALVNSRGLTELVVLTIGRQAGIIHQRLFTVLVMMALISTVTTGPLLGWVNSRTQEPAEPEPEMVAALRE